jgi:hypothetical protein
VGRWSAQGQPAGAGQMGPGPGASRQVRLEATHTDTVGVGEVVVGASCPGCRLATAPGPSRGRVGGGMLRRGGGGGSERRENEEEKPRTMEVAHPKKVFAGAKKKSID